MRRVVITGLGTISPLGIGLKRTWTRLLNGESGLSSTRPLGGKFLDLPCKVAGIVPSASFPSGDVKIDCGWNPDDWIAKRDQRRIARFAQFAIAAAKEALDDAKWKPTSDEDLEATGVYIGSGIGSLDDAYSTSLAFDKDGYNKVSPLFVPRLLLNLAAGHISLTHSFRGPNHTTSTACTTGLHAIGDAARMVSLNDANVMLAGGAEACIHPLALAGFSRCGRSLSTNFNTDPSRASRPFDSRRDGFAISEGAAVVVLEEYNHAIKRGARIYAEVAGYGVSSDAHHVTSPPDDGRGAVRAMRTAMRRAGVAPREVRYINAHATGTVRGDAAENRAIKTAMLGEGYSSRGAPTTDRNATTSTNQNAVVAAPPSASPTEASHYHTHPSSICVSSTKGATGHLLGAAGAIETLFTTMALYHNTAPPTINLDTPDLEAGFDLNYVPLKPQEREIDVAMTNSFGFGGTNASLVLKKVDSCCPGGEREGGAGQ